MNLKDNEYLVKLNYKILNTSFVGLKNIRMWDLHCRIRTEVLLQVSKNYHLLMSGAYEELTYCKYLL